MHTFAKYKQSFTAHTELPSLYSVGKLCVRTHISVVDAVAAAVSIAFAAHLCFILLLSMLTLRQIHTHIHNNLNWVFLFSIHLYAHPHSLSLCVSVSVLAAFISMLFSVFHFVSSIRRVVVFVAVLCPVQ